MGFIIHHPLIDLEVKLEVVERLSIHEEILKKAFHRLVEDIRVSGRIMHPIIVDEESLVVLDGNHRVAVAEELNWRYIPTCFLDYSNPSVKVGRWYRVFNPLTGVEGVTELMVELGLRLQQTTLSHACEAVEGREASASMVFKERCFTIREGVSGVRGAYNIVKMIESKLRSEGYSVEYETEEDAWQRLASGRINSVLIAPKVSKEEVVEAALSGRVLSHKATRHVIPLRPLFINTSIEWLDSNKSLERLNRKFVESLSERGFQRMPAGQVLDRRYEEELCIFG